MVHQLSCSKNLHHLHLLPPTELFPNNLPSLLPATNTTTCFYLLYYTKAELFKRLRFRLFVGWNLHSYIL